MCFAVVLRADAGTLPRQLNRMGGLGGRFVLGAAVRATPDHRAPPSIRTRHRPRWRNLGNSPTSARGRDWASGIRDGCRDRGGEASYLGTLYDEGPGSGDRGMDAIFAIKHDVSN